ALGLIGLNAGRPPQWDEEAQTFRPPQGDLVDIFVERRENSVTSRMSICAYILDREYDRPAIDRPWVFSGSVKLPDGQLAAEHSGAGAALVHMPDALLSLTRDFSDKNAELWALANTPVISAGSRDATLVFRAAALREHVVRIDALGDIWVDGRWTEVADLA